MDRIDRRGFLECMAWTGSALVWTVWTPNGSGAGAQLRAYDPLPVEGKPVLRWSAPVGTTRGRDSTGSR